MRSIYAGGFKKAFNETNRQLPVLLKVFSALCVYFLRDFLFLAVLIAAGLGLKSAGWRNLFLFGSGLEILWILVKINGAIGMAVALISSGAEAVWKIAARAYKQSGIFFWNGLATGVILFFGQLLLVCPCFLFLNNFIFSPQLFVYENIRGRAAKKRSRELAAGFGWEILNRTVVFIFAGYLFLFVVAVLLGLKSFLFAALLIFVSGIYLAQLQSNYIHEIYQRTLSAPRDNPDNSGKSRYKIITVFSIFILILIYLAIKILIPHSV